MAQDNFGNGSRLTPFAGNVGAATFFQSIENNKARLLITTRFVECENNRVTCTQGNNDAGCLNNDNCSTHPH